MSEERTIEQAIVTKAQDLFFAYGFAPITTDRIAAELGISKKTLYQHFESKEELLAVCMRTMREEMISELQAWVADTSIDFVEKLRQILASVGKRVARISRAHFEEIRRRAPHLAAEMEQFRRERLLPMFERLFVQGARHGMFRKDVDPHLFVLMFFAVVEQMLNPGTLAEMPYSPPEVFHTILSVMMEGMLTDEARSRLGREQVEFNVPGGTRDARGHHGSWRRRWHPPR